MYCVFVHVEKAYDRVPKEELMKCRRKSEVAQKYLRLVQAMCEDTRCRQLGDKVRQASLRWLGHGGLV